MSLPLRNICIPLHDLLGPAPHLGIMGIDYETAEASKALGTPEENSAAQTARLILHQRSFLRSQGPRAFNHIPQREIIHLFRRPFAHSDRAAGRSKQGAILPRENPWEFYT